MKRTLFAIPHTKAGKLLFLSFLLCSAHVTSYAQLTSWTTAQYTTYTVPTGCTQITADVLGGAGNSSYGSGLPTTNYGNGAEAIATYLVTSGFQFDVYVGARGGTSAGGTSSGGGEDGGRAGVGDGGGAGSDIRPFGGTVTSRWVVGGGGGGAGYFCAHATKGGNGGTPNGGTGAGEAFGISCTPDCTSPTAGGTQTGAGGTISCGTGATQGTQGNGGSGGSYGAGGGGGWWGGNGGGGNAGGGGSSYATTTNIIGTATFTASSLLNSGIGWVKICAWPTITSQPVATSPCTGGTAALTIATSDGTGDVTYQWYNNGSVSSPLAGTIATGAGSTSATYTGASTVTVGSVTYYYCIVTNPCGSFTSNAVSVTVVAGSTSPISGPNTVCPGGTINLTDATAGGTWSSSNTTSATVDASGTVYGLSGGMTNIAYSTGTCPTMLTVSVTTLSSIAGPTSVCAGSQINLTDATSGGVWSSTNSTAATISGSGVVSGSSAGTTNISYTVGSCAIGTAITVSAAISPITSTVTTVCAGSAIYLSDISPGGAWTSSNSAIATVSGGTVTGSSGGTTNISYTVGACAEGIAITVNSVAPITGPSTLCSGTISLSDVTGSGVWTSSNTSAATITGSGVVNAVAAGTTNISYTVGSCAVGYVVTVTGALSPITGGTALCGGSTTNLSDATPGGIWSTSNSAVATIVGGLVTGGSAGSANISYSVGGCSVGVAVTVTGSLSAITGPATVCPGGTIVLSDATAGGVWSSDNTGVATVSGSVIVTGGVSTGTADISYTIGSCAVGVAITVAPLPSITGGTSVCPGSTTSLSDITPGGVWTSSNSGVATISGSGVVYGTTTGSTNISYTAGTCSTGVVVTVTTLASITGATTTCVGGTIALSDVTSGGVWSSGTPGVATITGSGVVTGAASGSTVIDYTLGSCWVSSTVTVSGSINAITGPTTICSGGTITLSDTTPGGVWSSDNLPVAMVSGLGVVSAVSSGTTNISYTVGSCAAGVAITVTSLPPVTGPTNVCVGSTITLSDTTPGGAWTSGGPSAATVTPTTGVVTGVASGSASIIYTVGSCSVNLLVTVSNAVGPIFGPTTLCTGTTITLSDNTAGGAWSSSNISVATTNSAVVYGFAVGTSTISYTIGGCSATYPITVGASSAGVISGKDSVCPGPGHVITLSDNVSGGVWSSSSTSRATIDPSTGVVSGVATGTTTIRYVVTSSCGTYTATYVVHVRTPLQCATGIEPAEGQLTMLKIFPNPNSGIFTLNLSSAEADEEVHVMITNIVGQKVREFITTSNKAVDVKLDPVSGIYLISATTSHGRYIAKVEVH